MSEKNLPNSTSSELNFEIDNFQNKLIAFEYYITRITLKKKDVTSEERRKHINDNIQFNRYFKEIINIFDYEFTKSDVKYVYEKMKINPDAAIEWPDLFGYRRNDKDKNATTQNSVFSLSSRKRVYDVFKGNKKYRDVIVCMKYIECLDCFFTVTRKGSIIQWTNNLRISASIDIDESIWFTSCNYSLFLKRLLLTGDRTILFWDNRANVSSSSTLILKIPYSSPLCIICFNEKSNHLESIILFGDDEGYFNVMQVSLHDLSHKNQHKIKKSNKISYMDVSKLQRPIVKYKLHSNWINDYSVSNFAILGRFNSGKLEK
ncbi:hypothetical protein A3Q56_07727 [Intoshia linei]|uniref:Uncharacterized protein n=1 Tax=Intoshia linei TaxID=1819745 RepID=A0A177ARC4_9BILA|nr:hypothetical protein A3Q56_07727 [Intoshia linei]